MSKNVKVDLASRPKGDLVEVIGLGLFPNGETTPVTDDQIKFWETQTAYGERSWPDSGIVVTDKQTAKADDKPDMGPPPRGVDGGRTYEFPRVQEGVEAVQDEAPTEATSKKGAK